MLASFFDLPREIRDKIYSETWALTTRTPLRSLPSIHVAAQYAGQTHSYESYLDTAKCLMANRAMLSEALEEFHRGARTIFTRTSSDKSTQDTSRLDSLAGLLFPLRARNIEYVAFTMNISITSVFTPHGHEMLITHNFYPHDLNLLRSLAWILSTSKTLQTFKLCFQIMETEHQHQRFSLDQELACFKRILDQGCKLEIETSAGDLLPRTYPTPHDALLGSVQMLCGIAFAGCELVEKHGYDLEKEWEGEDKEVEERVVYRWEFGVKKG